jgi:hypothetical protein
MCKRDSKLEWIKSFGGGTCTLYNSIVIKEENNAYWGT